MKRLRLSAMGILLFFFMALGACQSSDNKSIQWYRIFIVGNSTSVGSDDERFPEDSGACPWTAGECDGQFVNIRTKGWRGVILNQINRAEQGLPHVLPVKAERYELTSSVLGGVHTLQNIGMAMTDWDDPSLPGGWTGPNNYAFVATHVNQYSTVAGGGECDPATIWRAGRPCGAMGRARVCPGPNPGDEDSPGTGCLNPPPSFTPREQDNRDYHVELIDWLLDFAEMKRVIYWKNPAQLGRLRVDQVIGSPSIRSFTFEAINPLALQYLFSDPAFDGTPCPTGPGLCDSVYEGNRRVDYFEDIYNEFCEASGYQGCPSMGTNRMEWFFASDPNRGNSAYVHFNAAGNMRVARQLLARLHRSTPDRIDALPSVPVISNPIPASNSIEVTVDPVIDTDGPWSAPRIYVQATCRSADGIGVDPACDDLIGSGAFNLPHDCGSLQGADHDGLGIHRNDPNPNFPERHTETLDGEFGGTVTLLGLAPDTDYRICAWAYDGFATSDWAELDVTTAP